jgi:hypothetical protein
MLAKQVSTLTAGKAALARRKKFTIPRLLVTPFHFLNLTKIKLVKLVRVILSLLILSIVAGIIKPLPLAFAADADLETSVVTLLLKSGETVIAKDPLFEILDLQNYILAPLTKLAARLEINFTYQREQNTLLLESLKTNRQVQVDLAKRCYLVNQEKRWSDQPPLLLNSEFYLSPLLFEYLAAVEVVWDFQYQELTVSGNWPVKDAAAGKNGSQLPSDSEADDDPVYLEGPACSLGTVRYELNWEYRKNEYGFETSEGSLSLRGDGRIGAWAISVGGEVTCGTAKDQMLDLTLIRAKYNDANKLIVFGDSKIYLEKTLQDQDLRGVLIISSEHAFSRRLIPYTTVTGPAEPGDRVVLYVNGQTLNETMVKAGVNSYRFDAVPLTVKRLNIIKIVIEKPSGEQLITEETVASSLKFYEPGTHEWMLSGGYYRQDDSEAWEDKLAVLKTKQSLFANLSLNSEIVGIQDYDEANNSIETIYTADTGIAFKLGRNTICALDWLVGGTADEPAQGGTADLLYCLEKGYLEGIVFCVDPTITETASAQTDPGKGVKLLGELEINDRTTYQAQVALTEPLHLAKMPEYDSRYAALARHFKYGDQLQHLFSVGVTNEVKVDSSEIVDTTTLYSQQRLYHKSSSLRNYLAGDYLDTVKTNGGGGYALALAYEVDYVKMYGASALYNLSLEAVNQNGYADYTQIDLDTSFKWFNAKRTANVYLDTSFFESDSTYNFDLGNYHTPFALNSASLGFWHQYFWGKQQWSFYTGCEWNYLDRGDHYLETTFNLTRKLPKKWGKYYAEYVYTGPYATRTKPQHSLEIGLERLTKTGFSIKLEAKKVYDSISSQTAEQVISLTCGRGFAFGSGRIKKIEADQDDDDLSIVSGVVYLDENGNSQWDQNEKVLPNVRMSLNGRQATTNAKGEYLYQYTESDSYKLFFDLRSLAADYTPIDGPKLFKLKKNENMFFDFGVTLNGSISGRLFIDQNSNQLYDESDPPLDWVEVILDHGKQKVFTGNDGIFYFEHVPLGEHTIEVLTASLPKDLTIAGKTSFDRLIKENALDIKDINIPVIYRFNQ